MTSGARLITNSGGLSSEGQSFNHVDVIESPNHLSTSDGNISPKLPEITIKYYGTIPPFIITKEHKVTNVADILELSRKYLVSILSTMFPGVKGLFSVTAPLFGLIDERHHYWLVSTDTVTSKSPTYYYRCQYCLPPESYNCHKLFRQDKFVCVYFFTQCRDDFINNRIPALYSEEKQDVMLGFVSADFQIPKSSFDYKHIQKFESTTTHNPLQSYKFRSIWKHLPKKCRKEFYSPISYVTLYTTIRDELRLKGQINIDKAPTLQREYVQGIFQGASEYCIDNYSGIPKNLLNTEEKTMNIKIYPYKEPSGVYYDGNYVFAISDIVDIENNKEHSINGMKLQVKIVLSSQSPEVIHFNYEDGLSFVYKLLGYHRMMVNYHMYISKDLDSSASNQLLLKDLHSFGPMTIPDAHSILNTKLNDYKRTNMGITSVYLIAQCMEEDKFQVISCNLCGEKFNHQLCQLDFENDCYSVTKNDETKTFKKILELLTYLKIFGRQIKPDRDNGNVWIKKIFSRNKENERDRKEVASKIDSGPQLFTSEQIIIDEDTRKEGDICEDIMKVRLSTNGETIMSMIQLKSTIPLLKKPTTDNLIELSDTLHKIKNSAFVRFFGVLICPPYRVLVDRSVHGSLLSIIRNKFRNPTEASNSQVDVTEMEEITLLQFVTTATFVAQGLEYLSQNNLHHGKIMCGNIYVYGLTNVQFDVKIGHPGLVKFYNKLPLTDPINVERIPWIGVELFDDLSRCSIESEIYSFSTFVWEFLSYGKKPQDELISLGHKSEKEWINFYKSGDTLKKPATLEHDNLEYIFKQEIKDQIWKLMCECWSIDPEKRPNIMDIIKRLRNMYSKYGQVNEQEINIEGLKQVNPTKKNLCDVIHSTQLQVQNMLGQGHYGLVKLAKYFPDGNKTKSLYVAVKLIHDSSMDTPENRERKKKSMEEEIKTMQEAQHENVVKILGVCYKGESQTVVMEYVRNGDLGNWLKKNKKDKLDDPFNKVYRKFVEEIAKGMSYLSSKGIVHRDLAVRNILITEDEHIKITDFGLAKRLEDKLYYTEKSHPELPIYWTAPECYGPEFKVTRAADVWSFGVVLWEIYSGGASPILEGLGQPQQHLNALRSGERLKISSDWPSVIRSLMEACWRINRENRPTFANIVQELNESAI